MAKRKKDSEIHLDITAEKRQKLESRSGDCDDWRKIQDNDFTSFNARGIAIQPNR